MNYKHKKGISFSVILAAFMIIFSIMTFFATNTIGDVPKTSQFGVSLKQVAEVSSNSVAHSAYIDLLSTQLTDAYLELYLRSYTSTCIEQGDYFFLDQSKIGSCFRNFSLDSSVMSETFITSIEQQFFEFESLLDSEKVDVSFSANIDTMSLLVESDYSGSLEISSLTYKQTKEIQIDLSEELLLLTTLKNNIELLSLNLQLDLPKCTITGQTKELCIKGLTENYLSNNLNGYDFALEYISETDFFVLRVNIVSSLEQKDMLSFSLRFEDNVPFYHVDFEIEPYNLQNDIVKVSIDKPREPGKNLHGFIVLYSYDNFFDSSTPGYSELISLLAEKQKIPNDFEDMITPYIENSNIELRRSSDTSSFDLSVVFVPASKDTSDKTNLLLHQIYDKSLGDYATLNSGRELFVYVFAVDSSYSYFVDENHFTSGIKSTFVKKVLPPFPLFELAVVEQPIPELNRGVAFSINGYDDVDFSSYLMYVCPTKTSFGFGNSGGCTSISSSLLTQKSGNFIFYDITQDTSFLSLYPTYQSLTTGSNLTRGNYFLYMLPQNIGGDFIGTDRKLEYKLVAEGIDGLNFYTFNRYSPGVSSSILRPYFLEFDVS
jgi:hypothetical protein